MNIICGNDVIDISTVESVTVQKATQDELLELEKSKNGNYVTGQNVFSPLVSKTLEEMLANCTGIICSKLPEPVLRPDDLAGYKSDYRDCEKLENWEKFGANKLSLISSFDDNGDAAIRWSFDVWKPRASSAADTRVNTSRIISLSKITPVLKSLLDTPKPKNAIASFFSNYKDIQKYIRPFYDEYMQGKKKIDLRNNTKQYFLSHNSEKQVLCITLYCESLEKRYVDGFCGFNIFEKEKEIKDALDEHRNYRKKVENSNNAGEKDVDYAIKWFLAAHNGYATSIKGDCESKYRINCIQLHKPDFIDEPQEMDHILVCSAGVVIIETKHWKGNVSIRPDGKWTRKADDEGSVIGVDSPKFQMRRHEVLMQQILPTVPVHSLLCFSNASTIIDGRENFKDYPIITVDQLEESLTELCSKGAYTKEEIEGMVAVIEAHKLYKA